MAMRLSQLKMLVAVAEHGSFSAAAAALGCTQSRISHAIAELEASLGAPLLVRARSGSTPTAAGQRVLVRARQMLALEADVLACVHEGDAVSGRVRIACFRSVGTHVLPHVLEALARRYPALHVDIDDSCEERQQVVAAVLAGRAELGLAQLPLDAPLKSHPWLHDDYVMVLPHGRQAASGGWPDAALPFIRLGCTGAEAVLARCRAAGFAAQPLRTLANDTSILAMVARGLGFSILPRLAAWPEPAGVQAVKLPVPARRQFVVAGLAAAMKVPAVRAVVRVLRERALLAQLPAWRDGVVQWD